MNAVKKNAESSEIDKIQAYLERLIIGKECEPLESAENGEFSSVIELLNILGANLREMNSFVRSLSGGNMEGELPGRRNYLAGPLKQLHSQMSNYVWIAGQLSKGKTVSKLDFGGDFGNALNDMIGMAASGDGNNAAGDGDITGSYQLYRMYLTFNCLDMMIIEVDESGKVIFLNEAGKKFLGDCEYLNEKSVADEKKEFVSNIIALSLLEDSEKNFHEINDEASGAWHKVTINRMRLEDGQNVIMYIIDDISEQKRNEEVLVKEATVDFLSNAANRKVGMNAIGEILRNKSRDTKYSVAFVDVNRLKYINDTYGHTEGDYTIKTIAGVLLGTVRSTDIVSRFGGDEFLIIFNNCDIHDAETVIERMHGKLAAINESGEKPYKLSFAHGATEITQDTDISIGDLITILDKKMYERKNATRGQQL